MSMSTMMMMKTKMEIEIPIACLGRTLESARQYESRRGQQGFLQILARHNLRRFRQDSWPQRKTNRKDQQGQFL